VKRAFIYARVSTSEQAEKGYSLPSQLEACQRYAETHGYTVVGKFKDDYTGAELERPEFTRMRDALEAKEAETLIVYDDDRLTRKLAHWVILSDWFTAKGIEYVSVLGGRNTNTPEDALKSNIKATIAEYERAKIAERTTRGRNRMAREGRYIRHGKPPYGYRVIDHKLTPYPPEAEIVTSIYTLYVKGDDDHAPMGLRLIARYLTSKGILTPSESAGNRHVRKRIVWSMNTVHQILTSETYAGTLHYRRHIGKGGKQGYRSLDECIPIPVTPIVSRELWQAAQDRIKQNKRMAARCTTHDFLLRGFVRCTTCDVSMAGCSRREYRVKSNVRTYYRCTARARRYHGESSACDTGYIPADDLDALAWSKLIDFLKGERFEDTLQAAHARELEAVTPRRDELARVEVRIAELKAKARTLVRKIGDAGELMAEALQAEIDELETQGAKLVERREELAAKIAQAKTLTRDDVAAVQQFRDDLLFGLDEFTLDDKREMLNILRAQVFVSGTGEGRIDLNLSGSDMSLDLGTSPPPKQPCSQTLPM
jgi:site-specific DNA recombinase